jgi:23S rRNA (guanosine2251-2'-O)-methyltransferase
MEETRFLMRQCRDLTCRFRFPAPAAEAEVSCPRCAGITDGSVPFPGRTHAPELPPATRTLEALLDNIRSIYNVGAMLRTADGAGIRHLHLCGITATPDHPRVAKTALGAQYAVSWSRYPNSLDAAAHLIQRGYRLWALESAPGAEPLFSAQSGAENEPLVLVVGNELAGVDPALLARCDRVLYIPMHGVKASLNAAVAFGIAAYYLHYGLRT